MTDGGYRGNPEVIMPYRQPADGELRDWQEELNAVDRAVRAQVEHTLARMKCWKILRDYRRAGRASGFLRSASCDHQRKCAVAHRRARSVRP